MKKSWMIIVFFNLSFSIHLMAMHISSKTVKNSKLFLGAIVGKKDCLIDETYEYKSNKWYRFKCIISNAGSSRKFSGLGFNRDRFFLGRSRIYSLQTFEIDAQLSEEQRKVVSIIKNLKYYSCTQNSEMKTDREWSDYLSLAPGLKEHFNNFPTDQVYCDFGCGEGFALIQAKKTLQIKVIGIDEKCYKNWNNNQNILFIHKAIENLNLYDVINYIPSIATDIFGPLHYAYNPVEILEKELSLLSDNGIYFSYFDNSKIAASLLTEVIKYYHEDSTVVLDNLWGIVVLKKNGAIIPFYGWLLETCSPQQCVIEVKNDKFLKINKRSRDIKFNKLSTLCFQFNYPPLIILCE